MTSSSDRNVIKAQLTYPLVWEQAFHYNPIWRTLEYLLLSSIGVNQQQNGNLCVNIHPVPLGFWIRGISWAWLVIASGAWYPSTRWNQNSFPLFCTTVAGGHFPAIPEPEACGLYPRGCHGRSAHQQLSEADILPGIDTEHSTHAAVSFPAGCRNGKMQG